MQAKCFLALWINTVKNTLLVVEEKIKVKRRPGIGGGGWKRMIIVNTPEVPGRKINTSLGIVKGSTVRSKHFGKDIIALLRTLVGGEIKEYTEMLEDARGEAMARMAVEAENLGANAIVNIRFASSQTMTTAAELLVYGTAVILD